MSEIHKGCLVESTAGRDKGKIFFVLDVDGPRAVVADGSLRRLDKPKNKNLRHLRFISDDCGINIADKIKGGLKLEDAEIRKALRLFLSEEVNNG